MSRFLEKDTQYVTRRGFLSDKLSIQGSNSMNVSRKQTAFVLVTVSVFAAVAAHLISCATRCV